MRNLLKISVVAGLMLASTAQAQTVQTVAYGSDIVVNGTWQDLVLTYGAMAGSTAWVANKSAGSIVVAFTPSATPPTGGGTVLAPNSPPLFGSAAHVWVRSLGGGSLAIGAGLGSAVASSSSGASATASATIPAYAAGSQSLSLDLSGQLRTRIENGANLALGSTADVAWPGSGAGSAISLLKTIATASLDSTSVQQVNVVAAVPSGTSSSSISSNVAASTASTQLLAANANRIGGFIVNDSVSVMYLKFSSGASPTSYDVFLAGAANGVPAQMRLPDGWRGPVFAAWASTNGTARVSERTQ